MTRRSIHPSVLVVTGFLLAVACSRADTPDIRGAYLALTSQPATAARDAEIDTLLREYHRRTLVDPGKAHRIVGVITDARGRPMEEVRMYAEFWHAKSIWNQDRGSERREAVKIVELSDGKFDLSWDGYDGVKVEFANTYFTITLRVESRGQADSQHPEANPYDRVEVEQRMREGEVLPLEGSKDQLRVVVRKLDTIDLMEKARQALKANPLKNLREPIFKEEDIKPGLVVSRSTEGGYVRVPADGMYMLSCSATTRPYGAALRKGDVVGFSSFSNGTIEALIPFCGGVLLKPGETAEWQLKYFPPDVTEATTKPGRP